MEDLKPPLEERYADEIVQGETLLLKAKPISTVKNVIRYSVIVIGIILFILMLFSFMFFQPNSFINDCGMIGGISATLFLKGGMGFGLCFIYLIKFLRSLYEMKRGQKTGWDGNPNKTVYEDTIIHKYTAETHKENKSNLRFNAILMIMMFGINLNWTAINESSSFAEANEFAHQQCVAEKVERESRKSEKEEWQK